MNKRNPQHLPTCTFLFGDKVKNMVSSWTYAQRSSIASVGSPRYDEIFFSSVKEYVYFAPSVVHEIIPSGKNKRHFSVMQYLTDLKGLDEVVSLVIHPHYREGDIEFFQKTFPKATIENISSPALPLIQNCSYVLTHRNSTSVLDAIACGKKVVLTNFLPAISSFYEKNYFGEFAIEPLNAQNCFDILRQDYEVNYGNYYERAKPYIYLGNASKRIADIVENRV